MEYIEVCDHHIENDVCTKCGLMLNEKIDTKLDYTKNCPQVSASKYNIIDTLDDIPMDVLSRAISNITNKELRTGKKVRNDAKHTFVEVYASYLECGYNDFNPQKLAKKLGLSRKDINWCLKMASGTSLISNFNDEESTYASIVILSPLAYLDVKCEINDLEKHREKIRETTERILEERDILYSSRPEYVMCAIIKRFCEIKKINTKCFSKTNDISDNALKKCMAEIRDLDGMFSL